MSSRLSCLVAGGLLLCVSTAYAQTSAEPQLVPAFPMPPLVVPITPTPLDGQTQTALDENKIRTFRLGTKNIKPSLLAHYLDPKNHPLPPFAQDKRPAILNNFVLPSGIDRIVAVDAQNKLLVFGTQSAVAKLQSTIALLDLLQINATSSVTLETSLYWIDSLTPEAQAWQKAAPIPRAALLAELSALPKLKTQDRASVQQFPSNQASVGALTFIPFESIEVPNTDSLFPNWRNKKDFYSPMPRIKPESDIDPGIQPHKLGEEPKLKAIIPTPNDLLMSPYEFDKDTVVLWVSGLQTSGQTLVLRDGETFLLSGSAKEKKLKSPSPRFDTFVVAVKVRVNPPATLLPTQ